MLRMLPGRAYRMHSAVLMRSRLLSIINHCRLSI